MAGQLETGDSLYEVALKLAPPTEYGVNMEVLMSGQVPPPAEGVRFDVPFEGISTGRLTGTVTGVDYIRVRADGRFKLHIHAAITTQDGENIAIFADGIAIPRPDSSVADLRENVTLDTSFKSFTWVNGLQIWAAGTVDLAKQEVNVRGFVA